VSSRNGGEGKMLVNSVKPIDDENPPESKEVHITLDVATMKEHDVERMKSLLSSNRGDTLLFFHVRNEGKDECIVRSKSLSVKLNYDLLAELSESMGAKNIKLVPGASSKS